MKQYFRFRHTNETIKAREPMSHAILRALVDMGETERLLEILQDKVSSCHCPVSIFVNHPCCTLIAVPGPCVWTPLRPPGPRLTTSVTFQPVENTVMSLEKGGIIAGFLVIVRRVQTKSTYKVKIYIFIW